MFQSLEDVFESLRKPHIKKVFFTSLSFNRRLLFWYADRVVGEESVVQNMERLTRVEELRVDGKAVTFICNHLTYADSHIIETLLIRNGFRRLADRIIHIAGQKTFEVYRRFMTRSLNTIRVYQPKATIDASLRKRMNLRALKWAAHLKRRRYCLLVFPEGTRTRRHLRFNKLSANPRVITYFKRSYVVPLALMGAERILPVGRLLPATATVRLRIGQPSEFVEMEKEYRSKHSGTSQAEIRRGVVLEYMKKIDELLDPEYRDIV